MIEQIKIKINLMINNNSKPEESDIYSINIEIPSFFKISDLVRQCVDLFNDKFIKEKSMYRLNQQYKNYFLKPSKKTGRPDINMPSNFRLYLFLEFNNSVLVNDTQIFNFSLIYKEDDLIVIHKPKKCQNCLIY